MTMIPSRVSLRRCSLAVTAVIGLGVTACVWQGMAGAQTAPPPAAQPAAVRGPVDGMWRMIATRQLGAPAISAVPLERQTKFKLITGSHYIWYVYDPATKDIAQSLTGTCATNGENYTETAQYGSYPELLGKPQSFTLKLEGNTMHLWGTLQMSGPHPWTRPLEEIWERVQ